MKKIYRVVLKIIARKSCHRSSSLVICSLNLKYQYILIYNYKFDTKISLQKTIYEKTV